MRITVRINFPRRMTMYMAHMPMDGVFNGEGGEGRIHTPARVPGGRKQEQQQRRGRVNVSMASTEEGPMHHGVKVACC